MLGHSYYGRLLIGAYLASNGWKFERLNIRQSKSAGLAVCLLRFAGKTALSSSGGVFLPVLYGLYPRLYPRLYYNLQDFGKTPKCSLRSPQGTDRSAAYYRVRPLIMRLPAGVAEGLSESIDIQFWNQNGSCRFATENR